ncbi:MAG: S8 family serine peptidase [Deltaproteobacteria bacterium]|nr:S8 family serine peptidase [Deltaproteobacteria bacterium]
MRGLLSEPSRLFLLGVFLGAGCVNANDSGADVAKPSLDSTIEEDAVQSLPLIHARIASFDPRAQSGEWASFSKNRDVTDGSRPFILQFDGHIQPERIADLLDLGVRVMSYVPDNALLVYVTPDVARLLSTARDVRAVYEQPPALRIDSDLLTASRAQSAHVGVGAEADIDIDIELILGDPAMRRRVENDVRALGGHVVERSPAVEARASGRILWARVPLHRILDMGSRTDVAYIGPHAEHELLNDTSRWTIQAGATETGRTPIWDQGLRGQGQTVGMADTGVFTGSCFFGGTKMAGYEDFASRVDGDGDGHGTHVAGSIAGDNNADGVYSTNDGMAPAARLFVQDVGAGRSLDGIPSDLGDLFLSAYRGGVRVHSNSWGSFGSSYSSEARSVDAFVASHPDFTVVFSNGNSGPSSGTVSSPATAKNVISVGATYNGAASGSLASFSSHGPTDDGRIKPTVSAPGVNIVSASNALSCGTRTLSGTSMAAPTVAGAVALVRQYFVDGYYPSGQARASDGFGPSAALIKATLLAGTRNMTGLNVDAALPGQGQGFGAVNLSDSLYFAGEAQHMFVRDGESVGQGTSKTYDVTVTGGPLRVALVWTDPPAATFTSRALVNDLNLVVSGSGIDFRGNVLTNGISQSGGSSDARNVEELVNLPSAPAGAYRITVSGANVPSGPQAFALVATGAVIESDDGSGGGSGGGDGGGNDGGTEPPDTGTATAVFYPSADAVGWTRSGETGHHLGDDDMYAGYLSNVDYAAVASFDVQLPTGTQVTKATLALTGQTTDYLSGGSFRVELIDLEVDDTLTHSQLTGASTGAIIDAAFSSSNLGVSRENSFTLPVDQIVSGRPVTVRIVGASSSVASVMSWDSGYGTGGLGIRPSLTIEYEEAGDSAGDTLELRPTAEQVGWVLSSESSGNHAGDDDIYAGQLGDNVYLGFAQFNAAGYDGRPAELVLTGQTTAFVASSEFTVEVVALSAVASVNYADVAAAPALAVLGSVPSTDVGARLENRFSLPASSMQTRNGLLTIRVRGSAVGSVMSWDSGYGTGGLGITPVLRVQRASSSSTR